MVMTMMMIAVVRRAVPDPGKSREKKALVMISRKENQARVGKSEGWR